MNESIVNMRPGQSWPDKCYLLVRPGTRVLGAAAAGVLVAVAGPPVGLGVRAVRPAVEREDAHCTMDTQSAAG
jgi:hypothetical protein